jgi:hypothetical protein
LKIREDETLVNFGQLSKFLFVPLLILAQKVTIRETLTRVELDPNPAGTWWGNDITGRTPKSKKVKVPADVRFPLCSLLRRCQVAPRSGFLFLPISEPTKYINCESAAVR